MEKVYYRGKAYSSKAIEREPGKRFYMLYENDILTHFVEEKEIERKSVLKAIFDFYYKGVMYTIEPRV